MTKLDGQSLNIETENIEQLKAIFPDVFTEGKVDFDKLRQVLGEYVEDEKERYNFTWNGKGKALRFAQTTSQATLRPCKEDSKDWDTTQNLYIEGDNLEVLKLLQKSYFSKVKMIYIDPPYNTGGDFVYPDNFTDSVQHYKEITGQIDGDGNKISTNTESSGRYHTDWLNMMYPRLRLARNLLTDDGVIFISIDDREVDNLKKICNEIFGEDNFMATIAVKMSEASGVKMTHAHKRLPKIKEYVLSCCKNVNNICLNIIKVDKPQWDNEYHIFLDNFSRIDYEKIKTISNDNDVNDEKIQKINMILSNIGELSVRDAYKKYNINGDSEDQFKRINSYRIVQICALGAGTKKRVDVERLKYHQSYFCMKTAQNKLYIVRGNYSNEVHKPRIQVLFAEDNLATNPCDFWQDIKTTGLDNEGDVDFKNGKKPLKLVERLTRISANKHDIILDFFSGSSTTAHAVMKLNAEDNGNRKFIMVQLPENLDKNLLSASGDARKDILSTIEFLDSIGKKHFLSEIGKERIRRAGDKIKVQIEADNKPFTMGQHELGGSNKFSGDNKKVPDIGFKVFKLDTSNFSKWQPETDNLEKSLLDIVNNYVAGRSEFDAMYEIILKMGHDLSYKIDTYTVNSKNIYSIGFGGLMLCLDDDITAPVAEEMVRLYKDLKPEVWKVVFKDNGFKTDSQKVNIKEILKLAGLKDADFVTV